MGYLVDKFNAENWTQLSGETAVLQVRTKTESLTLTEANLAGLSVNRYCVSGSKLEIGSAIASELSLVLNNRDRQYDHIKFEGAEIYAKVGVWFEEHSTKRRVLEYVPLGYFTVDETPRRTFQLQLKALDRMVQFDKPVDPLSVFFPASIEELISKCAKVCNVPVHWLDDVYSNRSFIVREAPEKMEKLTYRRLIAWCAEAMGTSAYIDWDGRLTFRKVMCGETLFDLMSMIKPFHAPFQEMVSLLPNKRFSSTVEETKVRLTGIKAISNKKEFLVGEEGYCLVLKDNVLIKGSEQTILENLQSQLVGLTYTPMEAEILSSPHIFPLDVGLIGTDFSDLQTILITNVTYSLNKGTTVESHGETGEKQKYASANPLTNRETAIIQVLQDEVNDTLNHRLQTVLEFNELISNALGQYVTPVTGEDGGTVYYMHDRERLSDSMVIFTMTAQGIAWTNEGWNGGNPVWKYGATSAGDALFRKLSAEGIQVSKNGSDYSIEVTPRAFRIFYKSMLVTDITADEMSIPKANFTVYAEIGKVRFVPYLYNGELSGTNLIYVD